MGESSAPVSAPVVFEATERAALALGIQAERVANSPYGPIVAWEQFVMGAEGFRHALEVLVALSIWEHQNLQLMAGDWLGYWPDPPHYELWSSPVPLRMRGGGDCEDLAADLVGAFVSHGHPAIAHLREIDRDKFHVTVLLGEYEFDPSADRANRDRG